MANSMYEIFWSIFILNTDYYLLRLGSLNGKWFFDHSYLLSIISLFGEKIV